MNWLLLLAPPVAFGLTKLVEWICGENNSFKGRTRTWREGRLLVTGFVSEREWQLIQMRELAEDAEEVRLRLSVRPPQGGSGVSLPRPSPTRVPGPGARRSM